MSLDALKPKNIAITNPSLLEGGSDVTFAKINVPIGQGTELGVPVDELKTGTSTPIEIDTKISQKQIEEALKSIEIQTGLTTKELVEIIEKAMGKSLTDLQKVDQKGLNDIVKHFNNTITALKEDNIEINAKNLEKYARLYNIQIKYGWDSIGSFREENKKNSESLIARLYRMKTGKKLDEAQEALELEKFKKLSVEEKARKLKAYFDSYFNGLVEPGKSREEVDRLQITDYTKLLFNSSPEEYAIFRDAIEYLAVDNRYKGYDAILESFDSIEERTNFVKEAPKGFVKKMLTAPDQRGEVVSPKQATEFVAVHTKYMDKQTLEEYREESKKDALEFYSEENKAKLATITETEIKKIQEKLVKIKEIEAIQRKLEENKEISVEEQALLDNPVTLTKEEKEILKLYAENIYHKGNSAGQIVGTGINKVITSEAKEEFLTTVNADAYEIGQKAGNDFYREVLTQVAEYAESLPDEEKANFVALMEKTIGENYTKVVDDIANGTTTELSAPAPKSEPAVQNSVQENVSQPNVTKNSDFGYNVPDSVDLAKPQVLTAQLYEENRKEDEGATLTTPKNEEEAAKGGVKAVKLFAKSSNTNYIKVALNLLDLNNVATSVKSWAFARFDSLNNSEKAKYCSSMKNNENKIKAGSLINSVEALEKVKCNNGLVAQHFEERIEKLKELQA